MTFNARKQDFAREHIYIVEIDADFCENEFGVSPCTATGTGDAKCYNTLASCQDTGNYSATTKTYRFCEPRSPHPINLEATPSLSSVSIAPAKIKLDGGLGVRASVSLTFDDHPASDIGIDPYLNERTYIAFERGSYWTKWRARNPFYKGNAVRVLSGYLVNGEFDATNFQTRHYILDSMDVSGGQCRIVAKDPLKQADSDRAQAPAASTGELSAALTAAATSFTLTPTGVGDAEYPASGFVRIRDEVMSFTRSGDTMTVVRGQYNTVATEHDDGDTVQLCLEYDGQVNTIIEDLLVNYAGIDSSFIPSATWQSEADDFLRNNYATLLTEPTGVSKLLKELGEQAPHYLYWDERTQTIVFEAIKPPPSDANALTDESNIIDGSFDVKDKQDLRVSTVFVYYGQFDPTKKLDEVNNYTKTYVRVNTDSIANYGSESIKTIYSRWIARTSTAQARVLAAKIGRRFGIVPREVAFALDPKDSDLWAGQTCKIEHRDITDFSGAKQPTIFQVLSVKEADTYKYTALEFLYDNELPEDEGGGDPDVDLLIIDSNTTNYDIRAAYDAQIGVTPDATTQVKVIVEDSVVVGSTSTATPSMVTGSFPTGATVTIENRGFIVGKGGDGAQYPSADNGEDGGDAISLSHPITLNNLGVIGGGGGGGGAAYTSDFAAEAGGGGGAGFTLSTSGFAVFNLGSGLISSVDAAAPTVEDGGTFSRVVYIDGSIKRVTSGIGGDLGAAGGGGAIIGTTGTEGLGGAAGDAIVTNGNTITYTLAGDIRGSVV